MGEFEGSQIETSRDFWNSRLEVFTTVPIVQERATEDVAGRETRSPNVVLVPSLHPGPGESAVRGRWGDVGREPPGAPCHPHAPS